MNCKIIILGQLPMFLMMHYPINELCKNSREKVVREFDSKVVAEKYIGLYESVMREIYPVKCCNAAQQSWI